MLEVSFNIFLVLLYFYYTFQISYIQKGLYKFFVVIFIFLALLLAGIIFNYEFVSWILITMTMLLFDLFYDSEPFKLQYHKILLFGIIISIFSIINKIFEPFSYLIIYELSLAIIFLLLSHHRKCLKPASGILVAVIFAIIIISTVLSDSFAINALMAILCLSIFIILEFIFQDYKTGFEKNTEFFQQNLLHNQYEEIKNIYLNMRGWRHDYHNHLQTIKAHLALNQLDEVQKYLLELEKDLLSIDMHVKSGNLMADAILNSKISIAQNKGICITCKAELPENLTITDIDMCVILGNLLDNATEACMEIDESKRFIRIYIAIIKQQLYISIQNSSKEELDFSERNYISTKRGEHGLGMKRVKILVDKYDGYLNLQNEPGIFASEVTFPLSHSQI